MTKTGLGDYLVDAKGMTLYYFTNDTVGKSNASDAIIANWPIFYAAGIAVPSNLNASDFGTITRDDGKMQTTYKGWPLYYYIKDQAAGDTVGQGVNNVWFVVNPQSFSPPGGASY
jgi:predicted lipoprotein with Yx(FWY)xxD motif